jgi:cobalt/nickel transport system permease protein
MEKLPDFLQKKDEFPNSHSLQRINISFIDKTIQKLATIIQLNYQQFYTSKKKVFLSDITIKTRLFVFFSFILLTSFSSSIQFELLLGLVNFSAILLISQNPFVLYRRILLFTFLFGFTIALPSSLNLISKGEIIMPLFRLQRQYNFWIYHIPTVIGFTAEGLRGMSLLILRVFNSVSVSILLISFTPFNDIIKGLKIFRIPDSFLMIIMLSYLYIIILSKAVLESYFSIKARMTGNLRKKEARQLIAGRINQILKMSRRHFEKTYQAMLSRGYSGEIILEQNAKLTRLDYFILTITLILGLFFIFL